MARRSTVAAKPRKKTTRLTRRGTHWDLMPSDNWERAKYYVHYEVENKGWGEKVRDYIKKNYDKKILADINKLPDYKVSMFSHWATTAAMLEKNPDIVPDAYKTGIVKWIDSLREEAKTVVAEKKAEEKLKKNVYVPSIQERMRETCSTMIESIEESIDNFTKDINTDLLKSFDPLSILRKGQAKPGHARMIRGWYTPERDELYELNNLPSAAALKKMNDYNRDQVEQLKEGYNHLNTKQKKAILDFFQKIVDACEIIEKEAKTTRAPRKVKPKSPDDLVKKLKFKTSDSKYGIASVPPSSIIGANIALVFNCKTRKLGMYYAQNVDPKGLNRDGSGLSVKGTSIVGYNEDRSIQKTVRKPEEILPQIKKTTRAKTEKLFDAIKTTDTKMNGRFNEETILLAVF